MLDESGLCPRREYDEAFTARLNEGELSENEVVMLNFEIYKDHENAVKHLGRIARIDFEQGLYRVKFQFMDDDLQPMTEIAGLMRDGIWNKYTATGRSAVSAVDGRGRKLILGNACVTNPTDGMDCELEALVAQDLALAR